MYQIFIIRLGHLNFFLHFSFMKNRFKQQPKQYTMSIKRIAPKNLECLTESNPMCCPTLCAVQPYVLSSLPHSKLIQRLTLICIRSYSKSCCNRRPCQCWSVRTALLLALLEWHRSSLLSLLLTSNVHSSLLGLCSVFFVFARSLFGLCSVFFVFARSSLGLCSVFFVFALHFSCFARLLSGLSSLLRSN